MKLKKKKTGKKSDFSTLDGLPVHSPLLKKKKKITIINGSKIDIFGECKERLQWLLFFWVDYIIYGMGYVEIVAP